MPIRSITILGTGLLGASVGLALRADGYTGAITGWDSDPSQLQIAFDRGAISEMAVDPIQSARASDVVLLSGPVFAIVDWMEKLAGVLKPGQLLTDVGSTKRKITQCAGEWFNTPETAAFLPGHPMAGKEVSGASNADASLFEGAVWLFTLPDHPAIEMPHAAEWRQWVEKFGCRTMDLEADRHDELCAWVSHLPQMVSTALSALLQEQFGEAEDLRAIGGRALREMTRLGSSPYSMWRDVAHTNTDNIGTALHALEQRLAHIRENLKTPELRDEFDFANRFRLDQVLKGIKASTESEPPDGSSSDRQS